MNVRMVPPYFCILGDTALFVEGYTSDDRSNWTLSEAPLINGRPDMKKVDTVWTDRDWSDTPWEGKDVRGEDIDTLAYWIGNLQRAFACIPAAL